MVQPSYRDQPRRSPHAPAGTQLQFVHRRRLWRCLQSPESHDDVFAVTTDGKVLQWRPREEQIIELASNLPPAYALAALP